MSAPNIISLTTITGKTAVVALTGSVQDIVSNAAASGKLFQVKSLYATNKTAAAATVTARVVRSATDYHLTYLLNVPPGATLVIVSRDAPINLEEGDKIAALADASSHIDMVASYEELS